MYKEFTNRLKMQGIDEELYFAYAKVTKEKVKEDNYKIFYQILIGGILGLIGCITKLPYHLNLIIIIISYIVLVYSTFITAIKQLSKKIINSIIN